MPSKTKRKNDEKIDSPEVKKEKKEVKHSKKNGSEALKDVAAMAQKLGLVPGSTKVAKNAAMTKDVDGDDDSESMATLSGEEDDGDFEEASDATGTTGDAVDEEEEGDDSEDGDSDDSTDSSDDDYEKEIKTETRPVSSSKHSKLTSKTDISPKSEDTKVEQKEVALLHFDEPKDERGKLALINQMRSSLTPWMEKRREPVWQHDGRWYQHPKLKTLEVDDDSPDSNVVVGTALLSLGADLLKKDAALFDQMLNRASQGDAQFRNKVLTGGTWSDKIAVATLAARDSPLHSQLQIESLLSQLTTNPVATVSATQKATAASKTFGKRKVFGDDDDDVEDKPEVKSAVSPKTQSSLPASTNFTKNASDSQRRVLECLGGVLEVFLSILPQNRKLRLMKQLSVIKLARIPDSETRILTLMCYAFEDMIKRHFAFFVSHTLGTRLLMATSPITRRKALWVTQQLVLERPEGEKELLTLLVNKLGDPDRVTAARSCHLSSGVLIAHPGMASYMVDQTRQLLMRPNVRDNVVSNAINFLHQVILNRNSSAALADALVQTYLGFFQKQLARMTKPEDDKKASKKSKKSSSLAENDESVAIESRLLQTLLSGLARALPYTSNGSLSNSKSEKSSDSSNLVNALFRLVHVCPLHVAVYAFSVLSKLAVRDSTLQARFHAALYQRLWDWSQRGMPQADVWLNLIHTLLSSQTGGREIACVRALLKRLLQIALANGSAANSCAIALLCGKLAHDSSPLTDSGIAKLAMQPSSLVNVAPPKTETKDDSLAKYESSDDEEAETEQTTKSSWVFRRCAEQSTGDDDDKKSKPVLRFNPWSRRPEIAGSETTSLWELATLTRHWHPSVSKFCGCLSQSKFGDVASYGSDPLMDFASISFLDRFISKNPKKINTDASKNPLKRKKSMVEPTKMACLEAFENTAKKPIEKKRKPKEEIDDEDVADGEFDTWLEKHDRGLFQEGLKDKGKKPKKTK